MWGAEVRDVTHREQYGADLDRQVDEEDPAPGEGFCQEAADDETDRTPARSDRAPDAESPGPLASLCESRRHDRQSSRRDECRPEALQGAPADQNVGTRGQTVQERGGRKNDNADD